VALKGRNEMKKSFVVVWVSADGKTCMEQVFANTVEDAKKVSSFGRYDNGGSFFGILELVPFKTLGRDGYDSGDQKEEAR
jgi:hypothetical protein